MNLLIEIKMKNQPIKLWKVRPYQGAVSIGTSVNARLRIAGEEIDGIHAVLDFKNGHWNYNHLSILSPPPLKTTADMQIIIDKPTEVQLGDGQLLLIPFHDRPNVFADGIQNTNEQFRWTALYSHGAFIESRLSSINDDFEIKVGNNIHKVALKSTNQWQTDTFQNFSIKHKLTGAPNTSHFEKAQVQQILSKGEQRVVYSYMAIVFLFFTSMMLVKPKVLTPEKVIDYKDVAIAIPQEVLKKKQEEKKDSISKAMAAALPPPQAAQSSGPKNMGSVISKIKSGSISNLIAKISAQGKKSANFIITKNGEKAGGATPTGKALSNIGKLLNKNSDLGNLQLAGGSGVNTVGSGGNVRGLASIGSGVTGQRGLELMEDESEVSGGLDRELIRKVIEENRGQILYCYERQLSATPNLFGKVMVKFTISADGTVDTQNVAESSLKSSAVEQCMLQKISRWKFPKPQGGVKVLVNYPFLFKSVN